VAGPNQVKVLVDTPIWIDHLHRDDAMLRQLLITGVVYLANAILGELAAGNLPDRTRTMSDLRLMPRFNDPAGDEVLDWIEGHQLGGEGLSWIACILLVTAEQNAATIYTRDRGLARQAEALKIAFTG
jgi:predicted nucleic acid-binding protein